MTAKANESLLMDARAIQAELGVKRGVADAIIRDCAEKRFVRPDGIRKLFVYREDVMAWVERNTRSAA